MKIAICCIVKCENLYLRDWVKYYYEMGVCNIILYDNNNADGEYPQQVIGDYISNGFVIYKNARGKYRYQIDAYQQCYNEHKSDFDWIGFLDIDEYWYLSPNYTFDDFFSEERLPNAGAIYLNWLCYGDDNKLHYEPIPVQKRFIKPTRPLNFRSHNLNINGIKKIFLKCRDDVEVFFNEVNDIFYYYYCDEAPLPYLPNGELYDFDKNTYDISHIKHYRTLTIEEFLCKRFGRNGYADKSSSFNKDNIMEIFWSQNEWTEEKQKIIDEFFKKYEITEDNIVIDAEQ